MPGARQGRDGVSGLSLDEKVLGFGFLPHEVKFNISKQCLLSVYCMLGTMLSPWGAFSHHTELHGILLLALYIRRRGGPEDEGSALGRKSGHS